MLFVSNEETEADCKASSRSRNESKDLSVSFVRASCVRIHSVVRHRSGTCSVAALLHCAPCCFVPSTSRSNSRRLGTLCTGGTSPVARAPRDQDCVQFFRQSAECSTHESFHGFADGSPGCQSTSSVPTLFIRLRQHVPFSPAKRTRVLLSQYLGDKFTCSVSHICTRVSIPSFCQCL